MTTVRPVAVVAALLLLPALGGCLRSGPSASCTVRVPPLSAGASAKYRASGYVFLPWTIGGGLVEWATVGPDEDPDEVDFLDLPNGSTIRVELRQRSRPTVDLYGRQRSAVQATFWAEVPDRPQPIPFADVWVDPDTGGLVKVVQRNLKLDEGDAHYFPRFGSLNHTGPLFAPLFSNRSLHPGDSGHVEYPRDLFFQELPPNGTLRWRVTDVGAAAEECRATVRVDTDQDSEDDVFRLTFTSDTPLPVRVRTVDTDPRRRESGALEEPLQMNLNSYSEGGGIQLAPFRGRPWYETTTLPRQAPKGSFLPGRGGLFPTSFDEASRVARRSRTGAWFQAHPEARVAFVRHWMGHPNSSINDKWLIQWVDPNGSRHAVEVTNESRTPLRARNSTESSTVVFDVNTSYPEVPDRWPTLHGMARLHRTRYDRDPTFLRCRLDESECWLGTHRSTHARYECDMFCRGDNYGGSGLGLGMVFWLDRGWYLKDQSWDPAGLTRPAR